MHSKEAVRLDAGGGCGAVRSLSGVLISGGTL